MPMIQAYSIRLIIGHRSKGRLADWSGRQVSLNIRILNNNLTDQRLRRAVWSRCNLQTIDVQLFEMNPTEYSKAEWAIFSN